MADTCLVTGGAGFIGSHLAAKLLSLGWRVRILDNFSTGDRANLAAIESRVELIEGDLRDGPALARSLKDVKLVFHQAALARVQRSIQMPMEVHDVNCTGTLKLLLACKDSGVRRVIFASSSSVYGDSEKPSKSESDPLRPISPYGASKVAAEAYCRAVSKAFSLHTVSLRYFNVFGPRQNPAYAAAIPSFITRALAGKELIIYDDGEQSRDFTFIDNVVSANILAADADVPPGSVFNIASGGRIAVNQLARLVCEIVGVEPKLAYAEPRPGDIKHSTADISAAKEQLGYRLEVDFKTGLRRTVEWFRRNAAS